MLSLRARACRQRTTRNYLPVHWRRALSARIRFSRFSPPNDQRTKNAENRYNDRRSSLPLGYRLEPTESELEGLAMLLRVSKLVCSACVATYWRRAAAVLTTWLSLEVCACPPALSILLWARQGWRRSLFFRARGDGRMSSHLAWRRYMTCSLSATNSSGTGERGLGGPSCAAALTFDSCMLLL